jgi:GT2 family glycosyltransferase
MTAPTVDFSIVVPTYNRPFELEGCLSALAALDYPPDRFEVIVVDDGSAEPLAAVGAPGADRLNLRLIRQENAGPAAARNRGVEEARGTWLAFTDDDCHPDADWLAALARRLKERPGCVVGGRTVNGLPDNLCSTMSQIIVDVVYRHYNARPDDARFFASNNLAMPRELFRRIGGFDESFTTSEDRDFCDRCRACEVQMIYASECVVRHRHALSFPGFCKQHFHYGRGAFRFHKCQLQRHSRETWTKTSFHMDMRNWLVYPFSQVAPRQWPGLATLLFSWQGMNLAGFMVEAARSLAVRPRWLPRSP